MHNLLYNYGSAQPSSQAEISIVVLAIIILLCLAIEIYLVYFAVKLARAHNKKASFWGVLTFIFSILAVVLLYIQISSSHILRSKHAWICKECGTVNFYNKSCTHCATQRISVKQTVENKFNPEKTLEKWTCPKCGQTNNSNAKKCIKCLHEKP